MGSVRSLLLSATLFCACSPALDWRQVAAAELGVQALFPCRPASLTREVSMPQGRYPMVLYACSAAGSTFALSSVSVGGVHEVSPTLEFLRDAAARNVGSGAPATRPFQVPGMTPNAKAGSFVLVGHRPDGSTVSEHLLLFVHGMRVYQASVVGDAPSESAVSTFFDGLKLTR